MLKMKDILPLISMNEYVFIRLLEGGCSVSFFHYYYMDDFIRVCSAFMNRAVLGITSYDERSITVDLEA